MRAEGCGGPWREDVDDVGSFITNEGYTEEGVGSYQIQYPGQIRDLSVTGYSSLVLFWRRSAAVR